MYSLPAGSTFTPNTLIQSSVVNGINNDLATDLNTPRPIVAGGTGASTAAGARAALGLTTGTFGFLFGLGLANNGADATNGIDVAVGTAATDDPSAPVLMTLSSLLTKKLNSNWAVGSGNGGLDTGSIANATYHVFLIQRSDTGVVDALFSLSASAPTMPTNYDRKRRIGSIIRQSATILAFTQVGDDFLLFTPLNDVSVTTSTTSALATLSVPTGLKVTANLYVRLQNNTTLSGASILVSSPDQSDLPPGTPAANGTIQVQVVAVGIFARIDIRTNTSGQIRHAGGNATSGLNITTLGWVDTRGRLG